MLMNMRILQRIRRRAVIQRLFRNPRIKNQKKSIHNILYNFVQNQFPICKHRFEFKKSQIQMIHPNMRNCSRWRVSMYMYISTYSIQKPRRPITTKESEKVHGKTTTSPEGWRTK